ncbi:MAG: hypothetical protein QNL05_15030 [Gammaproteobacteria bacterium]|nr:hypothetical protein [Gammaproteobacteria bacterium]MDX2488808.1 hypothetical protein [Gammaproteobacteria bacterium]
MTNSEGRDINDQPDLASHLHDESSAAGDAVAPKPSIMQDMEKSLVERIADIDDERRRTSTQLRKALQTHIEDVETRLTGAKRLLVALSVVVVLLAAAVVWLGTGLQVQRAQLGQDIADLRAPADDATIVENYRQTTDLLDARTADIERQLTELVGQTDGAQPPSVSEASSEPLAITIATLTERIEAIDAELRSLSNAPSSDTPDLAEAQFATERDQEASVEASEPVPIDKLINDQFDRLEQEYQRLAREIEAPAIKQSRAPAATDIGTDDRDPLPLPQPAESTMSTEITPNSIETNQPGIALQLIGFHSRDELNAFLAEHTLPNPVYIRSETFRGRPWFALIHSLYEDRDTAVATADALPEDLSQLDLWLRELPAGTTLERVQVSPGGD